LLRAAHYKNHSLCLGLATDDAPEPRTNTGLAVASNGAPVDIIQVLTQQPDFQVARKYWNKLKLPAADGKSYLTDVANAETLLRLVQSVPSPKAEPIKLWLELSSFLQHPSLGLACAIQV